MKLKLSHVSKHYRAFHVLKNITFEINTGDIVGFIGNNGAGKTTSIKAIFQELAIDGGSIMIDDHVITIEDLNKMAFFPDQNNFPKDYSLNEYCRYNYDLSGLDLNNYETEITEILDALDLLGNRYFKFKELSSGMQKRALLASVLVTNPELIILDEPTANVDVATRKEFIEVLKMLAHKRQITVMITSHDIEELDTFINKVVLVEAGEVVYNAPFDRTRENLSDVYLKNLRNTKSMIDLNRIERYWDYDSRIEKAKSKKSKQFA
jgi:ABC-2 type transport system ATP-binding protein